MVQAKLPFPTIRLRKRHSQFILSETEMRTVIQIQDQSKHHCSYKVIRKSENETTHKKFNYRLQGTTRSIERNSPQE